MPANCQDDILIWGDSIEQLRERTTQVFKSVQTHGLKLNRAKCQFEKTEVTFLGHLITDKGVEADPSKVEAIKDMSNPTTKKELQRFLGMITYLGKFIPNLADHTQPLRKLLAKDILWSFDQPQKEAVIKLKEMITTSPVLRFYDSTLPTRVSSDASITGLGAVLEQKYENNWYPVAYGSRSLGKSEQNYCQIESEILSIVYATQKFHNYVYGTRFQVYNDHLPLKSIFQKSITKAPPRIQRFLLRLMRYDFEMYYVPGLELEVADTLSRASLSDDEPEIPSKEMNCYVHMIANEYSISESLRKKIVTETSNDAPLKLLKKYIMNGWPSLRKEIEPEV